MTKIMQTQYTRRLQKVEEQLAQFLPRPVSSQWLRRMTSDPATASVQDYTEQFLNPVHDLLSRGGKRWRPVLMLLVCEMLGGKNQALSLVPLIELPHNGTLIVDDIEDGADSRRGAPAVHHLYGQDTAINSGNLLYFLPLVVIEEFSQQAQIRADLHAAYAAAMRRLHVGQGLDIAWHRDAETVPSEEQYLRMCRYKTGSLSRFAAQAGIIAATGSLAPALSAAGPDSHSAATDASESDPPSLEQKTALLCSCCEEAGVAFQILDDVRNLTTGNPGKMRGDDIVEGKKSLPFIYAAADPDAKAQLLRCFSAAQNAEDEQRRNHIEGAIAVMQQSGAVERADKAARRIMQSHMDTIAGIFPESEARDVLLYMLNGFVSGKQYPESNKSS